MARIVTVFVVDDEGLDRELLKNLIRDYCPALRVVGEAASVIEAKKQIETLNPQLVLLDINMPNQNGFTLLESFPDRKFLTVFTTGHNSYGIQAVKAAAFDYLLKPIDVDELIAVEKKALRHYALVGNPIDATLRLLRGGNHELIPVDDIILIAASGSYALVHLTDGSEHVLSKNIKKIHAELTDIRIQRVHRSYLVNVNHVKKYHLTGNEAILTLANNLQVPVSRSYKHILKNLSV
jgi:two-component system, LytTR family, response regulator